MLLVFSYICKRSFFNYYFFVFKFSCYMLYWEKILKLHHRMTEVAKGLWRFSGLTLFFDPKGTFLGLHPDTFWRSLHLGYLCQCFITLTVKYFLMLRWNWTMLMCPLSLLLALGTTERSLVLSSLHPAFRYLWELLRCLPQLPLQAEWFQLSLPYLIWDQSPFCLFFVPSSMIVSCIRSPQYSACDFVRAK